MTRSENLRALAQRVADSLPDELAQEVVLTGSVSRGMADEISDVEMLVVTREPLELEDCFELARAAGLDELATWGAQGGPTRRVSGYRERVPLELIWWPREYAEAQIDALLVGAIPSTADALAYGIALRTSGRLAAWQERLRAYPPALAAEQIEEAALPWGGFAPAGLLTLLRPGDRLALSEWIVDGALRVLTIVFALNRVWQPTTKRLAERVALLQRKPERLAERIEEALTESDSRRALRVMTELQLDTVRLAPSGPNVDRARTWLADARGLLGATCRGHGRLDGLKDELGRGVGPRHERDV
jgi:predicted nucleotidyltransferase